MKGEKNYTIKYCEYQFPPNLPILGLTGRERWPLPDGEITFLHCHNCFEIGYCHRGNGILVVEGKQFPVKERDITFVSPNTMHISKSSQGTTSSWEYIYIDVNRLAAKYCHGDLCNKALLSFNYPDFRNVISGENEPELEFLVKQLLLELTEEKENSRINSICLCTAFLVKYLRIISTDNSQMEHSSSGNKLAISAAIELVDSNYMNVIRIEDMAVKCNLSLTHFRRLFGKIMGESPLTYVDRIRVNKSCELLYSTDLSILDIATQVGFSSSNSYNRNFKKFMGMPPLQWRKGFHRVNRDASYVSLYE